MRRGNRDYWGARAAPISRGREDLHVLPVLYREDLLARTSEAKCRGLLLSRHEPEQRPALHESPSGSSSPAFLEPPHPCPRPLPLQRWSPSQPRTDGQEQTAPGRSHLETGTRSPCARGAMRLQPFQSCQEKKNLTHALFGGISNSL